MNVIVMVRELVDLMDTVLEPQDKTVTVAQASTIKTEQLNMITPETNNVTKLLSILNVTIKDQQSPSWTKLLVLIGLHNLYVCQEEKVL